MPCNNLLCICACQLDPNVLFSPCLDMHLQWSDHTRSALRAKWEPELELQSTQPHSEVVWVICGHILLILTTHTRPETHTKDFLLRVPPQTGSDSNSTTLIYNIWNMEYCTWEVRRYILYENERITLWGFLAVTCWKRCSTALSLCLWDGRLLRKHFRSSCTVS